MNCLTVNKLTWQSAQSHIWGLGRVLCLTPRLVDAGSRSLPDFLIIGAMKAGTTSLYHVLAGHPQVMRSLYKEVHFFDTNFDKGLDWYRAHFPREQRKARTHSITGECSPSYLFLSSVPSLVKSVVPNCRFIVVLRNPIDRAYSHYHHQIRRGKETLSFEEAIHREKAIIEANGGVLQPGSGTQNGQPVLSYLVRSIYEIQLRRWFDLFPREQFLILEYKDVFEDMRGVMEKTCSHLGVQRWAPDQWERRNVGSYKHIKADTREELLRFFEPHNARLQSLLGRSFDWA
jgi:hypothetical protein